MYGILGCGSNGRQAPPSLYIFFLLLILNMHTCIFADRALLRRGGDGNTTIQLDNVKESIWWPTFADQPLEDLDIGNLRRKVQLFELCFVLGAKQQGGDDDGGDGYDAAAAAAASLHLAPGAVCVCSCVHLACPFSSLLTFTSNLSLFLSVPFPFPRASQTTKAPCCRYHPPIRCARPLKVRSPLRSAGRCRTLRSSRLRVFEMRATSAHLLLLLPLLLLTLPPLLLSQCRPLSTPISTKTSPAFLKPSLAWL